LLDSLLQEIMQLLLSLLPLLVAVLAEAEVKHAPKADIPIIDHPATIPVESAKPAPVLTDQKCHIEHVELTAEVCTPTIARDCRQVKVKTLAIESRQDCVQIARTVCNEVTEEVDNTVCYTEYETETRPAEATTVEVQYEVKCENQPTQVCPQQGYGYSAGGYCKGENTKVCYNVPKTSPAKTTVSVELPVPREKCDDRKVSLPRVKCEEVTEEKCYSLPYTTEETEELEQCTTELGPPKCEHTPVKLPKQVCVGPAPYKAPAPYHAPVHVTPTYHAPTQAVFVSPAPPAYHAPAPPAYHAPVHVTPAYHAPVSPAYHAPAPAPYIG